MSYSTILKIILSYRYALPDVRRPAHHTLNGNVTAGKRQLSQLSQLSQLTEAFSPDNSFRYETYHRNNSGTNARHPPPLPPGLGHHPATATQPRSVRSAGAGSSSSGGGTYQSVGTPDEQDSTRTMTIHI